MSFGTRKTQIIKTNPPVKRCSCGIIWKGIPMNAHFQGSNDGFAGFYWDCICKSTLFFPWKITTVQVRKRAG